MLYAATIASVRAMAPSTGKQLWKYILPGPRTGNLADDGFMAMANGAVYQALDNELASNPGHVYAIRA